MGIVTSNRYRTVARLSLQRTDWDTLDFVDIEKNLAERLTDDNLHSILIVYQYCNTKSQNIEANKLYKHYWRWVKASTGSRLH